MGPCLRQILSINFNKSIQQLPVNDITALCVSVCVCVCVCVRAQGACQNNGIMRTSDRPKSEKSHKT